MVNVKLLPISERESERERESLSKKVASKQNESLLAKEERKN